MTDTTENARRAMLPDMPEELRVHIAGGGRVWTAEELRELYDVQGFAAPFVVVRRKGDGQRGSLQFTHQPRVYFAWQEDK